jgi:integrase
VCPQHSRLELELPANPSTLELTGRHHAADCLRADIQVLGSRADTDQRFVVHVRAPCEGRQCGQSVAGPARTVDEDLNAIKRTDSKVKSVSRKPSVPQPAFRRDGSRLEKEGKPGWNCRVYDEKVGQRQKTFYGTEREAHAFIASFREQTKAAVRPQLPRPQYVTTGQWALEFLRRYRWKVQPVDGEGGVPRPKTTWKNAKANVSAYIIPGLGSDRRMVSVTSEELTKFITKLRVRDHTYTAEEKELPPGRRPVRWKPADADTKDKVASITRLMFKAALDAGIIPTNPAAGLRTVWGQKSRQARVVIPSLVQVEDLAATMDAQWDARGDIIRVFSYTGMRWENLAALEWDDVDFELRSIYIWRARPSSTGEIVEYLKGGGDDHYVTIIDEAVDPLRRLKAFAEARDSTWVLTGERGGPLNYSLWRKHLDKARDLSGVPYTAHPLRHCCASLLIAGGADIEQVREQMSHKTTAVTQRVYRHAIQVDRRELARRLRLPTTGIEVDEAAEDPAAA